MEISHLAFNIQMLSIPPVAVLLWQLRRAVAERYLLYWTVGWIALAAALVCLRVAISPGLNEHSAAVRLALSLYCGLEYVFGFLLWAGCRALTTGSPLRGDSWVLGLTVTFGLSVPWLVRDTNHVFVYHAPIFGMYLLLALSATRGYQTDAAFPSFGVHVVRGCLLVLGLLFLHYGPATYWAVWFNDGRPLAYMRLSPMYNALAEVGLALGMAMLTVERVRDALDAKNRELAAAARTDALTGLLNRRALDALLTERVGAPVSGSVAVIDLNSLKVINDRHGHAAGDAAIRLVARALQSQFRITDPVFRLGGDEFLVVLEGGLASEMTGRMRALDEALKAQRLPGVAAALDLVVAWGLADFASTAEVPRAIERADRAMYACKTDRKAAVQL